MDTFPIDALLSKDPKTVFNLRKIVIETAFNRLALNLSFPRRGVQAACAHLESNLIRSSQGGLEECIYVFLRESKASISQYSIGRNMMLKETKNLFESVGILPFPEFDPEPWHLVD